MEYGIRSIRKEEMALEGVKSAIPQCRSLDVYLAYPPEMGFDEMAKRG
jgi:hypothetical protein